jgi:hypothetical protein
MYIAVCSCFSLTNPALLRANTRNSLLNAATAAASAASPPALVLGYAPFAVPVAAWPGT